MQRMLALLMVLLVATTSSYAENRRSSCAGGEGEEIKALSREMIDSYRSGKGMGLSKAAELNHYPGPSHALELAEALGLSAEQREKAKALFKDMEDEAVRLGRAIVEREKLLDTEFACRTIDEPKLRKLLEESAALQGKLRFAHMYAHLKMRELLSPEQIARYDELRGYGSGGDARHRH